MSWKTLNEILGLALLDPEFAQAFLHDPLTTATTYNFLLTPEEQEVLKNHTENTIEDLSRYLLSTLGDDSL